MIVARRRADRSPRDLRRFPPPGCSAFTPTDRDRPLHRAETHVDSQPRLSAASQIVTADATTRWLDHGAIARSYAIGVTPEGRLRLPAGWRRTGGPCAAAEEGPSMDGERETAEETARDGLEAGRERRDRVDGAVGEAATPMSSTPRPTRAPTTPDAGARLPLLPTPRVLLTTRRWAGWSTRSLASRCAGCPRPSKDERAPTRSELSRPSRPGQRRGGRTGAVDPLGDPDRRRPDRPDPHAATFPGLHRAGPTPSRAGRNRAGHRPAAAPSNCPRAPGPAPVPGMIGSWESSTTPRGSNP